MDFYVILHFYSPIVFLLFACSLIYFSLPFRKGGQFGFWCHRPSWLSLTKGYVCILFWFFFSCVFFFVFLNFECWCAKELLLDGPILEDFDFPLWFLVEGYLHTWSRQSQGRTDASGYSQSLPSTSFDWTLVHLLSQVAVVDGHSCVWANGLSLAYMFYGVLLFSVANVVVSLLLDFALWFALILALAMCNRLMAHTMWIGIIIIVFFYVWFGFW